MAELVAHYAVEQSDNTEDDILKGQNVARTERKKDFDLCSGMNNSGIHSVSELYDNIIWSVSTILRVKRYACHLQLVHMVCFESTSNYSNPSSTLSLCEKTGSYKSTWVLYNR